MPVSQLRPGSATESRGLTMKSARVLLTLVLTASAVVALPAQTDLDAFMQQVLARRENDWKKLQQYVLDERESTELRGPGQALLWGQRSDYTWYIRDGFFVRSPLKVNGATVGEGDRRKYEADFLKREQEREKRFQRRESGVAALGAIIRRRSEGSSTACSSRRVSPGSFRRRISSGSSSMKGTTRWLAGNGSRIAMSSGSSTTRRSCLLPTAVASGRTPRTAGAARISKKTTPPTRS